MDAYTKSRVQFETYAAMDAPDLPSDRLSALQVRLHRWAVNQFGCQPELQTLAGMGEEVGELIEAVVSPAGYNVASADDWRNQFSREIMRSQIQVFAADAVGDTLIYTTQLCTSQRLDFGALAYVADELELPFRPLLHMGRPELFLVQAQMLGMVAAVGRVDHAILKAKQGIRGFDDQNKTRMAVSAAVLTLIRFSLRLCTVLHINLLDSYANTAEHVMKRQWAADPLRAGGNA